ncbi:MAG: hypothetical protein Fur0036_15390 [Fimbriimonadaceae bacterium]
MARQLSHFAVEYAQAAIQEQIGQVNYMAQFDDQGATRYALVNPSEQLNEIEMLTQLLEQSEFDLLIDGLFRESELGSELTLRTVNKAGEVSNERAISITTATLFTALRELVTYITEAAGHENVKLEGDMDLFGTDNPEAFLNFMLGFDSVQYIERAQGQVVREFTPQSGFDALQSAVELDPDWEAPFLSLLNLARMCTAARIGTAEIIEAALQKAISLVPTDARGYFALGEFYGALNEHQKSAEMFEKAIPLDEDEPALYTRLGLAQMNLGMPANAERNFRKAIDRELEPKPSTQYLADMLVSVGRGHEVPALWKERIEADDQNADAHVRLGIALINIGQAEEGEKVFDHALEHLEDPLVVKRMYAPYLAQKGDMDRALDFYEDCLDVAPTDPGLMYEYAQTLVAANRAFEAPRVLRDMLQLQLEPNLRANVLATLVETDQPKRAEAVRLAAQKVEEGDVEGALRELRPLKTWLGDYWKMWAVIANAYNAAEEWRDAEEAAVKLVDLYPGCEPAYIEYATALAGQERHEEAYQALAVALNRIPGSAAIGLNLAMAAKKIGRDDEAKMLAGQLRPALQQRPDLIQVLDQLEK